MTQRSAGASSRSGSAPGSAGASSTRRLRCDTHTHTHTLSLSHTHIYREDRQRERERERERGREERGLTAGKTDSVMKKLAATQKPNPRTCAQVEAKREAEATPCAACCERTNFSDARAALDLVA